MHKLHLAALGLAAALFAGSALRGDEKAKADAHDQHAAAYDACAKVCDDCQRACDSCANHCANLMAQGKKEFIVTLRMCQDCGTHCSAAARIISRKGPFSDTVCTACAEACARCGKECGKYAQDAHMKQCADECKRCEKACREMLTHLSGASAGK